MPLGLPFRQVWLIDTEFRQQSRDRPDLPPLPEPVCLVARELGTDQLIRLWLWDESVPTPPFPIDDDTLFVAYQAAAEWGVFLQLGWPLPTRVIDLYVEHLRETNDGRPRSYSAAMKQARPELDTGLLGALLAHDIPSITSAQKSAGRELVMRGGPYTAADRTECLDYCQTDIDPLGALLERMLPQIRALPNGLGQAVIRGQYSAAEARMNRCGIPIDVELHSRIYAHKDGICTDLIDQLDGGRYGVYQDGSFRYGLFDAYLFDHRMEWPRTSTGQPNTEDETFKDMCGRYPGLENLRQLRKSLSQLRGKELVIGSDGRCRPWLQPYRQLTGRHNPSSSDFVLTRAQWMRGLVKPSEGRSLAYLDWRSQEVHIAAVLSEDKRLLHAVQTSDIYMELAIAAGMAPPGATKQTHPAERELAKTCFLAIGYGQQAPGMALRTGLNVIRAEGIIRSLRQMFRDFYEWSDRTISVGQMHGYLTTVLGWTFITTETTKPNTIRNFPVQANGAEMCRLAVRYATEAGVSVCAPLHDAILIETDTADFEDTVAVARSAMARASAVILDGVEIDTELDMTVHFPGRLLPDKATDMWQIVMRALAGQTGQSPEL
jgi:hypothetical protein